MRQESRFPVSEKGAGIRKEVFVIIIIINKFNSCNCGERGVTL
jgi:hypothetical protein